jgi:hypothetical protein
MVKLYVGIYSNTYVIYCRVSAWLLFNANSAIFQLYHGETKQVNFQCKDDEVRFVLDQHD